MKNDRTVLIRDLQGRLSDTAKACTRYNRPSVFDKLGGTDVTYYDSKLIVADYSDRLLSFTLKVAQIVPDHADTITTDALDAMVQDAVDCIVAGDTTAAIVDGVLDGLRHSGLNSSFVYVVRDIANIVADSSSAVGCPITKIRYIASSTFGNRCIGMVFNYGASVFILQFTD